MEQWARNTQAGLALALALGAAPALAGTLDEARALHREGRLREALDAYRAVVMTEPGTAAAGAAHNNACVILQAVGDHRGAQTECRLALALRRELDDLRGEARTLNNLGLSLQSLGHFDEAEEGYQQALEINISRADLEAQAVNLANLAALAIVTGRFDRAIEHLDATERLAGSNAEEPWAAEQAVVARINRGVVLEKLGAFREALDLYRELLSEPAAMDRRRTASLAVNAGVIYRNLGDPVEAMERFEQAAELYRQMGDRSGLAHVELNVGLANHLSLQRPEAAERAYREALRMAEEAGERIGAIEGRFYLARLLAENGRLEEAEELLRQGLDLAVESGSAEGRWSSLEGLGRVALARGRPEEALEFTERAIGDIEGVRSSLGRGRLRTGFFGDKRSVYATAVAALAELDRRQPAAGHAERALEVVQRAKARDLLDQLGRENPAVVPLATRELRRVVGGGLLLEYFVALDRLYLWTVDAAGVALHDLGEAGPVLDDAGRLYRALAAGSPPPAPARTRLADRLLSAVKSWPRFGGVVRIAPDRELHYLPFELLSQPGSGEALLERVTIAYIPSGSALGRLPTARRGRALSFAGFADPRLPADPAARGFSAGIVARRFELVPLPGARRELATVAARLPGPQTLLVGDEASEERFRQTVTGGVGVLHLAAHTVADESSARGAAVVLAPGGVDDGLLFPDEVAALEAPVGLTVLAACATRLGPAEDSGALASLTGAFLASGSSAVVATLWRVGDEATHAFMEQFYFHLGRGRRPEDALRRAKRSMRAEPAWASPTLWSGYVLVGEGERPPRPWAVGAVWWIAALAGGVLWLLRRRVFPQRRRP